MNRIRGAAGRWLLKTSIDAPFLLDIGRVHPNLGGMTSASAPSASPPIGLTLLLASMTAIGPFALQSLAPALPTLGRVLDTPKETTQLLVSLSMFALASGAVVYGPFADRYGRRPVILWGLGLAVAGSLLAAVSDRFELVLLGRLLQAAGAGAGMVLARAIARDLFSFEQSTVMIARITAFMIVAPMIAPLVGGALLDMFGWRSLFVGIATASLALLVLVTQTLKETLRTPSPSLDLRSTFVSFRTIVGSRAFVANSAIGVSSISSFFLLVGAAPYLMEDAYGYAPSEYGAAFLIMAGCYASANMAAPMVARVVGAQNMLLFGTLLSIAAFALFAAIVRFEVDGPYIFTLGCALGNIGAGFSTPFVIAGAVNAAPERAGSASGLFSLLQFSSAGVAAQFATQISSESGWPLLLTMAGVLVVGLALYLLILPRRG